MRRSLILSLLATAAVLLPSFVASAATASDPNDTPGRLDLSSITTTRLPRGVTRIVLVTYGGWSDATLGQGTGNELIVRMDLDGNGTMDCRAVVSTNGTNNLHAETIGKPCADGPFPVGHPNPTTAVIRLPAHSPGNPDQIWHAAGASRFTGPAACAMVCIDRAPDTGWLLIPAP